MKKQGEGRIIRLEEWKAVPLPESLGEDDEPPKANLIIKGVLSHACFWGRGLSVSAQADPETWDLSCQHPTLFAAVSLLKD